MVRYSDRITLIKETPAPYKPLKHHHVSERDQHVILPCHLIEEDALKVSKDYGASINQAFTVLLARPPVFSYNGALVRGKRFQILSRQGALLKIGGLNDGN